MKTFFIITLTIITGFIISTTAFASNKYEDIYGSKVDQMMCFYKARLYLLDSEYKILCDIGEDALMMLDYLKNQRGQLIQEMKEKRFFRVAKMKRYIVNKARIHVSDLKKATAGLVVLNF